jgi:hypothetical protein
MIKRILSSRRMDMTSSVKKNSEKHELQTHLTLQNDRYDF